MLQMRSERLAVRSLAGGAARQRCTATGQQFCHRHAALRVTGHPTRMAGTLLRGGLGADPVQLFWLLMLSLRSDVDPCARSCQPLGRRICVYHKPLSGSGAVLQSKVSTAAVTQAFVAVLLPPAGGCQRLPSPPRAVPRRRSVRTLRRSSLTSNGGATYVGVPNHKTIVES